MSKKLKLSPWHYGSVDPVHPGVYEAEWSWNYSGLEGGVWFNFWDGHSFYSGGESPECATIDERLPETMRPIRWRGILK